MALEEDRRRRHTEFLSTLDRANDVFEHSVRDAARSLVLYRIAGSTEKRDELSFLLRIVNKINGDDQNRVGLEDAKQELRLVLDGDIESTSVGSLFSIMTDILDALSTKNLYDFLDELRKEPVHSMMAEGS